MISKVGIISLLFLAIINLFWVPLSINLYLVIFIVVGAALMDTKTGKIPNFLTFPAMVVGLSYYGYFEGWRGYLSGLAGLGIGMGFFMPFYLIRGMGAGDVKLMGAAGSLLGKALAFKAVLAAAIVGGALSVFALIIHGCLGRTIKRYWLMLKCLLLTGEIIYIPAEEKIQQIRLHYGIAIALGTMILILIEEGL
jgi:prepilin peptidase CpaA